MPVGERNYELGMCSEVAKKIESEIEKSEDQLHPHSKHASFSVGYDCLYCQCSITDWLRHFPPDVTAPAARRVDSAIMKYLHSILGAPAHLPDIVRRRMQLPGRHFGLGYRIREELIAPVAFVSGFIEAHE